MREYPIEQFLWHHTMFRVTRVLLNQAKGEVSGQATKIVSSCPAGTPLNLQIKKSGKELIALDDKEYPEWLWTVLDPKVQAEKLA